MWAGSLVGGEAGEGDVGGLVVVFCALRSRAGRLGARTRSGVGAATALDARKGWEANEGGVESTADARAVANGREGVHSAALVSGVLDVLLGDDDRVGLGGVGITEPGIGGGLEVAEDPRVFLWDRGAKLATDETESSGRSQRAHLDLLETDALLRVLLQ